MERAKKNHHPGQVRMSHPNLSGLNACIWLAVCGLDARYPTSSWPITARGFPT